MISMDTMNALVGIINNGRNFYAQDYKLNGGTISILSRKGMIEKTGNFKDMLVEVGYCGDLKEVRIYEWRVSYEGIKEIVEMIRDTANEMLATIKVIENLY